MTLWLIRAGSRGEHEQKFLDEGRVYVAWDGLNVDLKALADRQGLIQAMEQRYPDEKPKALINWSSQVWSFGCEMAEGDWVVMPSKSQSGLYFGELKGSYHYEASGPDPYFHWREINWFSGLVPRSAFPQDLLYSFGAFLTICKVQRNDAEARVKAMAARQWQPESISAVLPRAAAVGQRPDLSDEAEASNVDLEELAADRIVRLIEARFKGHGLAAAALEAMPRLPNPHKPENNAEAAWRYAPERGAADRGLTGSASCLAPGPRRACWRCWSNWPAGRPSEGLIHDLRR